MTYQLRIDDDAHETVFIINIYVHHFSQIENMVQVDQIYLSGKSCNKNIWNSVLNFGPILIVKMDE